MKKKSNSSSNRFIVYSLLFFFVVLPVLYFIFLFSIKVIPVLSGSNKSIFSLVTYRPNSGEGFKGDADASITFIVYSGFFCSECRSFYSNTYKYLEENYIRTGKARYYYSPFVTKQDIKGRSIEYNVSRYLYCLDKAGSADYWDRYDFFFRASEEEAKSIVSSSKGVYGTCFEQDAVEGLAALQEENNFFGINSQPALFMGIDRTDNSALYGVPKIDLLKRVIRQKEITLGEG